MLNDISSIIKHETILFADDISIIVTSDCGASMAQHETEIKQTLTLIKKWLQANNLKMNLSKTNIINFNNFKDKSIDMTFDKTNLRTAENVTFLGIIINSKLDWKEHVEKVCNKLNRFAYALYKLSKVASKSTALTTYYAYVESVLRYGLLIWGNSVEINKAFIAQKRCVRAIGLLAPDEPCRPYFRHLNILPLPSLYIYEVAVFTYLNMDRFIKSKDITGRSNRDPNRLVLDVVPKSKRFLSNCYAMCATIFNSIPNDIKCLQQPSKFKKVLRQWLAKNAFYSVGELLQHK